MDLTINHFKKFLIDEIIRQCNATYPNAIDQVNEFSKTDKFYDSYDKWKKLQIKNKNPISMPIGMEKTFKQMGIKECTYIGIDSKTTATETTSSS